MEVNPAVTARVLPIQDPSQVGEARRFVMQMAKAAGLDETDANRAATLVSEAASNLCKHATPGTGEIILQMMPRQEGPGVDILALDGGPGIPNLGQSLTDGYSSVGTQGIGLGGIRRMASEFDIFTGPQGTAVMARVRPRDGVKPAATAGTFECGGVCLPVKGETLSGDAWEWVEHGDELAFLMADGLGHGPFANEAAREAVEVLRRHGMLGPEELLRRADGALRKTRGAAVSVGRIKAVPGADAPVEYSGCGNIAAWIVGERSQALVSMNGTVGHECRKIQVFKYSLPSNGLLVLHSDGLMSRWDLGRYAGLRNRHPLLVAGVLYRDYKRGRDDVSVAVIRRAGERAKVFA